MWRLSSESMYLYAGSSRCSFLLVCSCHLESMATFLGVHYPSLELAVAN